MKTELYMPSDTKEQREKWESIGYGVCGISCLATLFEVNHSQILKDWKDYVGFAPMKDLRAYLVKKGFSVKLKSGKCKINIVIPNDCIVIARIQWKGKEKGRFHGYTHWTEASKNTHLILIKDNFVYANEIGWFFKNKLINYLRINGGYITSYFEIRK